MRKAIKIILLFIICVILPFTVVKAEDEACKITLSADKTTLKPGDEVTITLLMENITKSSGIVEFMAGLDFSKDVFDVIFEDNEELKAELERELGIEGLEILYNGENDTDSNINNPWFSIYSEPEGIAVIYGSTLGDPQVESQIVGKIKLKVKENATTTQAKFSLLATEVYDAENIDSEVGYTIADSEIILQVTGKSENVTVNPGNTNTNTNNNTNTNANTNTNTNINTNVNTNKTNMNNTIANKNTSNVVNANKATQNVPYTGIEDWAPFIFIGIIISVIAYVNYRKYKDI